MIQTSLTPEKAHRDSNPAKKRPKLLPQEPELSDSDVEYVDFNSKTAEFTANVGDETSSAVQSIQQVCAIKKKKLKTKFTLLTFQNGLI